MIPLVGSLIAVIAVLCSLLVYSGIRIESLLHEHEQNVDHAKCLAHVAHYTGNHFAAIVLRSAAEDYSTAEGQHELRVLVQSGQWSNDGLAIPSLWMLNRADKLVDEVRL